MPKFVIKKSSGYLHLNLLNLHFTLAVSNCSHKYSLSDSTVKKEESEKMKKKEVNLNARIQQMRIEPPGFPHYVPRAKIFPLL